MRGRLAAGRSTVDYWPGFVDALATLLLVITFLLSIFMVAQFFLSRALTGRDAQLIRLENRIGELATLLDLERGAKERLEHDLSALRTTLEETSARAVTAETEAAGLRQTLETATADQGRTRDEITALNTALAALREQIETLQASLDAAEAKDHESQIVIEDLGRQLNVALAQKVSELAKYRSEFFGRLREVLGERSDVQIVGDRFVFQSEVLFDTASAEINQAGTTELKKLSRTLLDVAAKIPLDVPWILRVDGHSDARPIATAAFPSNWHLSAARAIAVVNFLIAEGVPAARLAATGFGANQPLDESASESAYRRNRRIEIKLTER